jgi:hypothetical protein
MSQPIVFAGEQILKMVQQENFSTWRFVNAGTNPVTVNIIVAKKVTK